MPIKKRTVAPRRYEVGYGRPPQKSQFKKGRSGNPTGINRKASSSIAPDLKALFERALNKKIKLRRGEKEQLITMGAAGIDALVNQFSEGDHRARRDVMVLAEKLGVDLTAGYGKALESALAEPISAEDEALLVDFVERHGGHYPRSDDNVVHLPPRDSKSYRDCEEEDNS